MDHWTFLSCGNGVIDIMGGGGLWDNTVGVRICENDGGKTDKNRTGLLRRQTGSVFDLTDENV